MLLIGLFDMENYRDTLCQSDYLVMALIDQGPPQPTQEWSKF
jgi:hypothetical protein